MFEWALSQLHAISNLDSVSCMTSVCVLVRWEELFFTQSYVRLSKRGLQRLTDKMWFGSVCFFIDCRD